MNFTREPVVETVITAKDGCKLVVRNSKASAGEEYFVEAIEVVVFGSSTFYRSLEKPKSFLVPVGDYEVIEVRETRLILKNSQAPDRYGSTKAPKIKSEKQPEAKTEERSEKRREKRKSRRRSRREGEGPEEAEQDSAAQEEVKAEKKESAAQEKESDSKAQDNKRGGKKKQPPKGNKKSDEEIAKDMTDMLAAIIPPPSTLVSEVIGIKPASTPLFAKEEEKAEPKAESKSESKKEEESRAVVKDGESPVPSST